MKDNNVRLYHAEIGDSPLESEEWARLSPAEAVRARAMRDSNRQREFVRSRLLARRALAEFLGRAEDAIEISADPTNKPVLLRPSAVSAEAPSVEFNQSHSAGVWIMAIARDRSVGIDVEGPSRAWTPDLVQRICHPEEWTRWQALPAIARPFAARRAWCQKEAVMKALGRGLALDPRLVVVEMNPEKPPGLLQLVGRPIEESDWKLALIETAPALVCVLAGEGFDWLIQASTHFTDQRSRRRP